MTFLRTGLLVALVVALLAVPATRHRMFGADTLGGFAAFYCGGEVLRDGHDPYRAEPLRACEKTLPSYQYGIPGVVEPAPFPPVVLAAFGALSLLPFGGALGVYDVLALLAIAFACWALCRITGFSPWFVGAALAVAALYENVRFGEIPPLIVGILCGAALLLQRGRPRAAALVASLSLIEPHAAGPVLLALFVAVKPARATLAVVGAVLAVVSLLLYPALNAEFFAFALPAHAAAEITANDQYSVTWIAHVLGIPNGWAMRAGSISYAVAAVLGVLAGTRLATRFAQPAFVVFVPAAFAVIGGVFIHDLQLPIALPAALLLASVTAGRTRACALAATFALAVTWFADAGALLALAALAVMAWSAPVAFAPPWRRAAFTASICAAYACAIVVFHALSPDIHAVLPVHPDAGGPPGELASVVWGRYVVSTPYGWASARTVAEKLPLFGALALVLYAALRTAYGNDLDGRAARAAAAAR